ncbi:MAG: SPOR domain-containing protein [Deltaproteobacteria bacterium]|jgi:hypothetical protein|nr:SPOR domain-containing protein [Deltaproteobacteria bacterium]
MADDRDRTDPALEPIVLSEEDPGPEEGPVVGNAPLSGEAPRSAGVSGKESSKAPGNLEKEPPLKAAAPSGGGPGEFSDEEWYRKNDPGEQPEYTSLKKKSPMVRLVSVILAVVLAVAAYYFYRRSAAPPPLNEPQLLYQLPGDPGGPDRGSTAAASEAAAGVSGFPASSPVERSGEDASPPDGAPDARGAIPPSPDSTSAPAGSDASAAAEPYSFSPGADQGDASTDLSLPEGAASEDGAVSGGTPSEEGALFGDDPVSGPGASALVSDPAETAATAATPVPRVIPQANPASTALGRSGDPESTAAAGADGAETLTALSGGTLIGVSAGGSGAPDETGAPPPDDIPLDPMLDSEAAASGFDPDGGVPLVTEPGAEDIAGPPNPALSEALAEADPEVSSSGPAALSSTVSPPPSGDPGAVRPTPRTPSSPRETVAAAAPEEAASAAGIKPPTAPAVGDSPPVKRSSPATVAPSPGAAAPRVTAGAPGKASTAETVDSGGGKPKTADASGAGSLASGGASPPEEAISELWVVSMYSSSSEDEALSVLKKLQSFKPEGTLYLAKVTDKAGNLIHRVRLGYFKERDKADSVARDLAGKAKTPADHWSSNPTVSEVKQIGAPVVGGGK